MQALAGWGGVRMGCWKAAQSGGFYQTYPTWLGGSSVGGDIGAAAGAEFGAGGEVTSLNCFEKEFVCDENTLYLYSIYAIILIDQLSMEFICKADHVEY
jgi:hypothetical protein